VIFGKGYFRGNGNLINTYPYYVTLMIAGSHCFWVKNGHLGLFFPLSDTSS
jgi:hypothetical protein